MATMQERITALAQAVGTDIKALQAGGGATDVDGNAVKLQIKSLTRAQLEAAATGGTLIEREPYLITDEGRLAVGTSASAYASFAKEGEVAAPVEVVAPPVNVSPASGATEVSRTAILTGGSYSSSTGVAQGAVRAQVSATSDFSGALLYDSGEKPPGNAVAIPIGTLSNGIAVQWRIAYKSASGQWSEWSLPTAFTTLAVNLVMTGGTLTSSAGYNIHTFTGSGSLVVPGGMTADVLVVAGGGGGGGSVGGGGGGGGVVFLPGQAFAAGAYSVVVGAGGNGGIGATKGGNGGDSSITGLTAAVGGGGGGMANGGAGLNGGSGGGSGYSGTPGGAGTAGQGYAGGPSGGAGLSSGGGGAGGVGKAPVGTVSGDGGPGFACAISPERTHYAGGGSAGGIPGYSTNTGVAVHGGGRGAQSANGAGGTPNTGGGGGGGGNAGVAYNGGAGGSGVVIIRYQA